MLINLYEENDRPKFPVDYIKANLKTSKVTENESIIQNNKLREENRKLRQKIVELEKTKEKILRAIEKAQEESNE